MQHFIYELNALLFWLNDPINNALNPPEPIEPVEETKKKGAAVKKDDKGIDPNIPLPTSGINTLVICLDHRLHDLPIENLPCI